MYITTLIEAVNTHWLRCHTNNKADYINASYISYKSLLAEHRITKEQFVNLCTLHLADKRIVLEVPIQKKNKKK